MRKALLLLLLLQGCHLGPRYEVPESQIPAEWKTKPDTAVIPNVQLWWEVFEDEILTKLERQVLAGNPDLYSAFQRIEEARAIAGLAKSELYPQASLQPSYNDTGQLFELYGVPPGVFPGLKRIVRVHEMSYQLPVHMSYEVDLWQKYRGRYNAADKYSQSEEEAYCAMQLTLTTDLANNYFNAKTLDSQNQILAQIVEIHEELLRLKQLRYLAGVDSYLSVLAAIQSYEEAQSQYESSLGQRTSFENAIATLVGLPASDFRLEELQLQEDPPLIPVGLPSMLLMRRPDVASAERSMAAAHDLIGVAYANFLPDVKLTGAFGFLSPELSQFMSWASHLWEWGAQIFQTIFDGFARSSILKFNKALFEELVGSYQKTVLTAFQEVEDALNDLEQDGKQSEELFRAYEAADKSATLHDRRFDTGVSNQLDVLTARLSALKAESNWINTQGQRYQATLQLIKAIGGSWGTKTCAEEETQVAHFSF